MKFNFFKNHKTSSKEILNDDAFEAPLPEIYRGVQVFESDSDRFGTFDEDYFVGEEYEVTPKKRRKPISPPKTPPSFLAGILCGALTVLTLSGFISFFTLFSKFGGIYSSITVPNLTALSESEAISLLKNNYDCFDYSVEYKENPNVDEGYVISQIPKPSSERKLYGINGKITVKLIVSKSADYVTLPSLVGQSARDVMLELQNAGINVYLTEVYSDTVRIGRIISASHPEGSALKKNDTVYITASLGKNIRYVSVPSLIGLSESAAVELLKKRGLNTDHVTYKPSDKPLGTVIEQSIKGGSSVREDSKISIFVSGGAYTAE